MITVKELKESLIKSWVKALIAEELDVMIKNNNEKMRNEIKTALIKDIQKGGSFSRKARMQ